MYVARNSDRFAMSKKWLTEVVSSSMWPFSSREWLAEYGQDLRDVLLLPKILEWFGVHC
jgi:hypothetical protein